VTDEARAVLSADDAELLNRVCAGETAAFQVIYQRHAQAARWLARDLAATLDEADDVVAETFEQLLEVTRRGSGPADAFRPYMLTALRRVCDRRREESQQTTGDHTPDAAEPYLDLAVASPDDPLIVRAYLSLPERWMAVLWHTEIEGASQAEVGPVLGLTRNGVAALRRRAKEGLTQAYLQMYTSGVTAPECATVALRLGPFIRDAVSGPDSATVTQHLSQCDRCRSVFAELSDVSLPMRAMVAPAFLGGSAAYYLASTAPAAKVSTAPAPAPGTTAVGTTAMGTTAMAEAARAGAGAGPAWWLRPAGFLTDTARPRRWLAAGGAAVIVLGAIAFAVVAAGHGAPLKPAGTDEAQAPASLQVPTALDKPSATPAGSTTAPGVVRASASRSTRATPASSPGPTGPASQTGTSPAPRRPGPSSAVRLTAAVDVYGGHHDATVVFKVSDTGSASTRALIVSVALPAGSSLVTWPNGQGNGGGGGFGGGGGNGGGGNGGGGHQGDSGQWGQSGWSCKATSSGARCRHAAIPAGGQSQGVIFISINASSACGQTVSVTVTSRSASATAQSAEEIQC
jgi:RNA polymerase sigma factor (sigma-70 family)